MNQLQEVTKKKQKKTKKYTWYSVSILAEILGFCDFKNAVDVKKLVSS